jgi:hypothetical protein
MGQRTFHQPLYCNTLLGFAQRSEQGVPKVGHVILSASEESPNSYERDSLLLLTCACATGAGRVTGFSRGQLIWERPEGQIREGAQVAVPIERLR